MKLLVQTAAPLIAPAKSDWGGGEDASLLGLESLPPPHGGETDTGVTFVSLSRLLPPQGRAWGVGWGMGVEGGRQQMPHLSSTFRGSKYMEISEGIYCQPTGFQQDLLLLLVILS